MVVCGTVSCIDVLAGILDSCVQRNCGTRLWNPREAASAVVAALSMIHSLHGVFASTGDVGLVVAAAVHMLQQLEPWDAKGLLILYTGIEHLPVLARLLGLEHSLEKLRYVSPGLGKANAVLQALGGREGIEYMLGMVLNSATVRVGGTDVYVEGLSVGGQFTVWLGNVTRGFDTLPSMLERITSVLGRGAVTDAVIGCAAHLRRYIFALEYSIVKQDGDIDEQYVVWVIDKHTGFRLVLGQAEAESGIAIEIEPDCDEPSTCCTVTIDEGGFVRVQLPNSDILACLPP